MDVKTYYSDESAVELDLEYWRKFITTTVVNDADPPSFRYTNTEGSQPLSAIIDMIAEPMLIYALNEMRVFYGDFLSGHTINSNIVDLELQEQPIDNYQCINLTYDQVVFINEYTKEVSAFIPLVAVMYLKPNKQSIRDFISGNI